MPGRSQDSIPKPVVVIRRRAVAKSTVSPPAAQPAVSKPQPVATATHATATQSSRPVSSPPGAPKSTPAPKPPTPPEDPAVSAARRAKRIKAAQALLTEIMERWPQTFAPHPIPVRPLARGIGKVIAAQLPQSSAWVVHHAIALWQRQRKTPYLQALIAGGPRYDLDGNLQGEVTPEEQERARTDLVAWRASRQEKRRHAAQRDRPATRRAGRENGTPPDASPAAE